MKDQTLTTLNSLSASEAAEWTENWRQAADAFNFKVDGFTVLSSELLQLLGVSGGPIASISNVRFYLALNSKNTTYRLGFHLIFCGVDEKGNDIICPIKPGDQTIFDFTNPCPPTCGLPSCLNSNIACDC